MVYERISEEFNEQIASHYRLAATKGEAQRKLTEQADQLLKQIPEMVGILNDYPAYAGLAFYGKFQFVDKKLIEQLAKKKAHACDAIDAIRAAKALRIAATTKPAWDCLLNENPEALWVAIRLNLDVKIPYLAPRAEDEEEFSDEREDDRDEFDEREDEEDLNDDSNDHDESDPYYRHE